MKSIYFLTFPNPLETGKYKLKIKHQAFLGPIETEVVFFGGTAET